MKDFSKVKPGDVINITPIDKFPNCVRHIKVDCIEEDGFLYDLSETCDGYVIPFEWIKDFEIVKRRRKK